MKIFKKEAGFTLIELIVVVAIIALLATVVLAVLSNAKNKGSDAAVKANLTNALKQAEIFYNINTAAPNSYASVCTNGTVGGAMGVGSMILAAAKARGLSSYSTNPAGGGDLTTAKCKDIANNAWAAEVPLKTAGQMWCVDSTGTSKQTGNSIGFGWTCI